MQEIERKWLVRRAPANLDEYPSERIEQGYLVLGEDGSQARVRSKGERFALAVKKPGHMSREEYEIEITREQFETLWPATDGRRLIKRRYRIPITGTQLTIELDLFEGRLAGLQMAEVEFESETAARTFTAPAWFDEDVTENPELKNSRLTQAGCPDWAIGERSKE